MHPDSLLEKTFRLNPPHKQALGKLGLKSVHDLLYYFPARYNTISEIKKIAGLCSGDTAVIYGRVLSAKTSRAFKKKIPIGEVVVEDDTGKIKATWFHQAYAAKMVKKGDLVKLAGRVTAKKNGELYLANPEFERTGELPIDIGDSLFAGKMLESFAYAIYPESRGVTSRWLYHAIQKILASGALDELKDPIPEHILKKYHLPGLKTSLIWIHSPKKDADAQAARKRFAFEEIFFIQLERQRARHAYKQNPSFKVETSQDLVARFIGRFSFDPTAAQKRAIEDILSDMKKDSPMSRLLEGDVGSGKTAVAATTAYAALTTRPHGQDFGNLQVAYMAPTEILAEQHFQSFIGYFKHLPINIGLITGSGCKKFPSKVDPTGTTAISRAQLLKWAANGEIAILIGTHSLIQKTVKFKELAYVIIDEQHRFGTMQRGTLVRKDHRAPHLLSMTATPIPRTLALTIYGDLDLTLLDEMPKGRKEVLTEIVVPGKREEVYEKVRQELRDGRQAYVICPRIDEADPDKASALRVKSVKEEAARLKKNIFPEYEIDVLHGKLLPKEKEEVMRRFANHETDILVATSVVEVGVNVQNATVIIIEGAERFGLAQLHQLRGRVLRSTHQAYCYCFADSKTKQSLDRLKALKTAKNGFELSELDLSLRGTGALSGTKQWGISDLGMEAIKNIKMVEAARTEALALLESDPKLAAHPLLSLRLASQTDIHFE
ncbi:MAG: ATP-dependent DNA helicase RecG [Patescibacteria group bacterium]